jgi:hypothetical protein
MCESVKKNRFFKAVDKIERRDLSKPSVFLAGSIDGGEAHDWQERVTTKLKFSHCNIFNPRREEWDESWEQSLNSANFYEQVNWEIDALEEADVIALYFADGSKSPISLLEFGMFVKSNKLVVYCDDFYRKGNVDVVCQRFGIPVFTDEESWISCIKRKLKLCVKK